MPTGRRSGIYNTTVDTVSREVQNMDNYMHTLTHMPVLGILSPKTPTDIVLELFTYTSYQSI